MAAIEIVGVTKQFGTVTAPAVAEFDLHVEDGEFLVLVGPSGCGKTTLLRMLAGLETVTSGEILIDGRVMNGVHPRDRNTAMVFQNYALYPHMSVYENIAFPLRSQRMKLEEIRTRVEKAAATLGLTDVLKRRPRMLSGGQRQRVAIGRAIVREPAGFLMDEPLSNLDAKLRTQMRADIAQLQRSLGVTTVYVTHDQVEAMAMADRMVVMRKGVLQQCGTPRQLYDTPENLFVAEFVGSPATNLLRGRLELTGEGGRVWIGEDPIGLSAKLVRERGLERYRDRDLAVGLRPEHLREIHDERVAERTVRGTVKLVEALGAEALVHLDLAADRVVTDEVLEIAADLDAATVARLRSESSSGVAHVVARVAPHVAVAAGRSVWITVPPEDMMFFDLESGRATGRDAAA